MSKSKKYALNGAFIGGVVNAIWNTINQLNQKQQKPDQTFSWEKLLIAAAKGAVVGAFGGAIIGAIEDENNAAEKPINTDAFLYDLASEIKLDKNDKEYLNLREKADILCALLENEFKKELKCSPFLGGSTEKGTALKDKFDIDIYLCFKRHGFATIEEMYYEVLDFVESLRNKHGIVEVRNQQKSVGIIFKIGPHEYKIDVVPYRTIKTGKNAHAGNLYLNDKDFFTDNSSYTKTDLNALNSIKLSKPQQTIYVILKQWKLDNDLPLSSHLLQYLILESYDYNRSRVPKTITKKVIMVLSHIADNLNEASIVSIENSNNILTDISEESKRIVIDACVKAIKDYEYQPNSIVDTFKTA